jgi:hypothetical protein
VWSLEKIAVWRHLFNGAARLLLKLAEAENESYANNATGVFAGLFSPGYGGVAPTEATPEDRFPVLRDAFHSHSKEQRRVALRAADRALEVDHFSRMVGTEHQGLRQPPQLWIPATWGELFDSYRRVWELLETSLSTFTGEEREEVVRVLLRHADGVGTIANLTPMVTITLSRLLHENLTDRREVIEVVESIYRHRLSRLGPEARQHWDDLRRELTPQDLHGRLERYVGMDYWFHYKAEAVRPGETQHRILRDLAQEAIANRAMLRSELSWLVTQEAKNGFAFGEALGQHDVDRLMLEDILAAQAAASVDVSAFFLAGYLHAIARRSPAELESILDRAAADLTLRRFVPELTWRSSLTDRGARRVLNLALSGAFDPMLFRMFSYGGIIRNISEPVFHDWIRFLLAKNTRSTAGAAVDLFYFYYVMHEPALPLPRDLSLMLVTAAPFFNGADRSAGGVLEEHSWAGVVKALIEQHHDTALEIGRKLLLHFDEQGTVMADSASHDILKLILQAEPHRFGAEVLEQAGPPVDARSFRLTYWLRRGPMSLIPLATAAAWVDEDVTNRAPYAAGFVEPSYPGESNTLSARELLVRYGLQRDVRRALIGNFFSDMWWGKASNHFESKLRRVQEWKVAETHPEARLWLAEYEQALTHQVEQERIREERTDP